MDSKKWVGVLVQSDRAFSMSIIMLPDEVRLANPLINSSNAEVFAFNGLDSNLSTKRTPTDAFGLQTLGGRVHDLDQGQGNCYDDADELVWEQLNGIVIECDCNIIQSES